jgi:low temperature requirement protein LtrA
MKNLTLSFWDFLKYLGEKTSMYGLEFIGMITTFFAPAGLIFASVGFAIMVDTYFGRKRARYDKEEVTSKKTRVGVVDKSYGYLLITASVFIADVAIVNEIIKLLFPIDFLFTRITAGFFIWIEYTSVNESYMIIKGMSLGEAFRKFVKSIKQTKSDINEIKKS